MDTSHLNRSQIRAQHISEDLQNFHVDHLNTFIEGVSDPEPPKYQYVKGEIQPPLAEVSIKEEGMIYDFGNVFFEKDHTIRRVKANVENGKAHIQQSEQLPRDDNNSLTIPVAQFVVSNLYKVWKAKHQEIAMRKDNINAVRAYAHSLLKQPVPSNLYSEYGDFDDHGTNGLSGRKRKDGEPIPRHPSNKRMKVSLDLIPASAKSEIFDRIPKDFKTQFFNIIVKTAFPNFEDVMMAAWNAVSVYEHIGTNFPDLHKAMTELKSVFHEFEKSYGKTAFKTESQQNKTLAQNGSAVNGSKEASESRSNGSTSEEHRRLFVSEEPSGHQERSCKDAENAKQGLDFQGQPQETSKSNVSRERNQIPQSVLDTVRSAITQHHEANKNVEAAAEKSLSKSPHSLFKPDGPRLPGMDPRDTLSNGRYPVSVERKANKSQDVTTRSHGLAITFGDTILPNTPVAPTAPRRGQEKDSTYGQQRNARAQAGPSQLGVLPLTSHKKNTENSGGSGNLASLSRIVNGNGTGVAPTAPMSHTSKDGHNGGTMRQG
ncbi:uncharacterized protein BDR25DRAFT_385548 [Lindgomyces ingoldianus]|uniref:Uncharacterized protein n=1 Tax=Lindgomyces ingoldianus TaxID=673940 RepID=A0ACB6R491_9PLEO|nr:uncharacterized protein BDR25DRAFT_385548 [Lindgomyces ingoldianus]KAF2474088.1 hypothetical protein BDR25DRAFT_385548 [Lindgomyces ingoldianus]